MPLENRKRKKYMFWERFNQTLNKYIPAEHKIWKNKKSENYLLNIKSLFSRRNLKNLSGEYGR